MSQQFKTGRLPAVRPAALADLSVYANARLPTPPPSVVVPQAQYPIDDNQKIGDCTIAGVDHLLRAWNVLYGNSVAVPTEPKIEQTYFDLTGGEDTGLNENAVLKQWRSEQGLFGSRIHGYAPVDPRNLLTIHQAIAFYGGAYLGILCPRSAQVQFANGEPWTYVGEEAEDGHCVVALGFTAQGNLLVATWGGIAEMTASFMAHYLDEAWCILGSQLVAAKKDTLGIDLKALQADLDRV